VQLVFVTKMYIPRKESTAAEENYCDAINAAYNPTARLEPMQALSQIPQSGRANLSRSVTEYLQKILLR
jgi:hypothetical protein